RRRAARLSSSTPDHSFHTLVVEAEDAGDDHELHFVGALADLEYLRVAVVAGDEVLIHEAVAAEDLGGVAGVLHGGIARDELGNSGLGFERQAGVAAARRVMPRESRRVHTRLHSGDHELDVLVIGDGLAEHHALPGVANRLVDAALGSPDRK